MTDTTLKRVRIEGYKSIRELDIELKPLNVLIGANGSGKSNFIGVFNFLRNIIEKNLQLYVARSGGANSFLHFGEKNTKEIKLGFYLTSYLYHLKFISSTNDKLSFVEEYCDFYKNGKDSSSGGVHLHDFGYETALYTWLELEPTLEKELPYYLSKGIVFETLEIIKSWKIFHFHDTTSSANVKKTTSIYDSVYLHSDAGNLAAFLLKLKGHFPKHYKNLVGTIQLVAPFFSDFVLEPLNDNLRLRWREQGAEKVFDVSDFSDGTLRFICLATLLLQPELPALILIDEPELGLHPYAIDILAGMLKSAAVKSQVIVTTQSVTLANQFRPQDIIVVEREEGQSVFKRLDENALRDWLPEYAMGELWEKNIIGGNPFQ